jgi:recombination protein RecR
MMYPPPIENLIDEFRRFPGIGPKSAERFVFHLLRGGARRIDALNAAMTALRDRIDRCVECGMVSEQERCRICANPRRDRTLLCVVAEPTDLLAVDRSGAFQGIYHVLDGLLAPIEGIGPEELRITELVARIRKSTELESSFRIQEVVLAFDPTIEGETTVNYLAEMLSQDDILVTRLARGLPVGGDLEYTDPVTLAGAMSGRRALVRRSAQPVESPFQSIPL